MSLFLGMRLQSMGSRVFPILLNLLETEVFSVDNAQITSAMRLLFERMKIVVEPSGAATTAALLSERFQHVCAGASKVGVVIGGGNADLEHLPWLSTI